MPRRGTTTLPLHDGTAPSWLFDRMVDLADAIARVIVDEFGPDELLHRLADPHWFQAFGCVLGFDWHSSGLTTTTMGALKEALEPNRHGLAVAGGKGATSRRTPSELAENPHDLPGGRTDELVRASRLSAKVDSACLQDGFELYHHTMAVSESGRWTVVQQGMDGDHARRYHWLDGAVGEFVEEPHAAICSQDDAGSVLDLTAEPSAETRAISVDLVQDDPARLRRYLQPDQRTLTDFDRAPPRLPRAATSELTMPDHHLLRKADLSERAIEQLDAAYEVQPREFEELVELEGIGPASIRALALIAELVYEAESSHEDPAKFAYAHGGKDGTPRPINPTQYDRSISFLEEMVEGADTDRETKQAALNRLTQLEAGG